MTATALKRRSVRSGSNGAADAHERGKDFLTVAEIDRLLKAAKTGRHGPRDYLLVLMMYRHGLRASKAVTIRRDEIDLAASRLWCAA